MIKSELVDRIAAQNPHLHRRDIEHIVNAILDKIIASLSHGYCLGGGLELALACDYRFATDNASFGFPEALLGLHPGLGGTARLTHLINPLQAMTMMLTGSRASGASGQFAHCSQRYQAVKQPAAAAGGHGSVAPR